MSAIEDEIANMNAKTAAKQDIGTAQPDYLSGLTQSIASAMGPEMIGQEPLAGASAFREENPIAGATSQLLSPLADYGMAFKGIHAAEELPAFGKFMDTAFGTGDSILSGAARGGAEMGAIEGARVAGSAATGGDTGQTAEEGAFDVGAGMAFGGLGGMFRAGGKSAPSLEKLGLGLDMRDAPQVQMKTMKDSLASGEIAKEDQPSARAILGDMKEAILSEDVKGGKYVGSLIDGDAEPINKLFKPQGDSDSPVVVKRFIPSGKDFGDATSAEDALASAGIANDLDAVQYPRLIAFNSDKGAASVEKSISENLTGVAPGEFLGKEEDGLYVYAKKVLGAPDAPTEGDRWLIAKTSDPQRFAASATWAKAVEEKQAWLADKPLTVDPANPKAILDKAVTLENAMPLKGYYQATSGKSGASAIGGLAKMLGYEGESDIGAKLKGWLKETFLPAMDEYKDNPRAQRTWALARSTFQDAEAESHGLTHGEAKFADDQNLYKGVWKGGERTGKYKGMDAYASIVKPLSDDAFADVIKARNMALPPTDYDTAVANRIISPEAAEALKKINKLDEYMINQTKLTQDAVGEGNFSPIKGHYLLPFTWEGDWRTPIYNETGQLVHYASGKSLTASEKMADAILANGEVKGWYKGKSHTSDAASDFDLARNVRVNSPEYLTAAQLRARVAADTTKPYSFQVRTGVQGYKTNFTKSEAIDAFQKYVTERNRYLAQLSVNKVLGAERTKLIGTDKLAAASVERRINAMAGRQGGISKAINQTFDQVFSSALGKNSASKIANTITQTMGHLTWGAGNIQRPVIDSMQFMQTVLPRIAFTLHANEGSLRSAYSWLPVIDKSGLVKGSMGFLEPLRIMRQSFGLMARPTAEFAAHANQALQESTINEFIGKDSNQSHTIQGLLKGEEGYSGYLQHLSHFLPMKSWQLARANAFAVGHILGKGLNLEGDGLFRFSKEFTEKTMYSYAVADKPRVFSGPAGSVFGQFKNWTMHYLANMMEYAGEGYKYNNWAPLLWQMGGTTALGGLGSTAMAPIANGLSQLMTNKSLMENLYEQMGGGSGDKKTGNMADAVFLGLPAFLGVSLSNGMSDPMSDPSRDAAMMFSFPQAYRAIALGKAFGQAWDNYKLTGEHPVDSQATRDLLIKALAPKTLQNIMAQTQDDGIRSLNNGNRIIGNLNTAEKMMVDAGFQPKRIALAHEVNEELWKDKEAMASKVSSMSRLWHEAEAEDDYDMLTHLNTVAMTNGIDMGKVIAGAKSLDKKAGQEDLERNRPADVFKFQNLNIVGQ